MFHIDKPISICNLNLLLSGVLPRRALPRQRNLDALPVCLIMKSKFKFQTLLMTGTAAWLSLTTANAADPAYPATIQSQNPIAYWRFNDGVTAPVYDTAANLGSLGTAADGLYNSATHPVPTGLAASASGGTASAMSGGQHIRIPFNADLNPSESFSVEAWLRPNDVLTGTTLTCALSSGHFGSPRAGWLIYQGAAGFNFRMFNQNGTTASVNISGGGPLTAGTWYHVVATYDGSTAVVYVNGSEVVRDTPTGYVAPTDGAFAIGMRADNSFVWSGQADEVALYGTALTADQVTAHFNVGSGANAEVTYEKAILVDHPLGYWRLNEAALVGAPVAANAGSLGAPANGAYHNGASNSSEAPKSPAFNGFEDGNTSVNLDGASGFVGSALSLLNDRPAFTISGWVRRAQDQPDRTGLWGQNDLVEIGYINNNTIQVWTDANLDITPNPFPNEEWDHLAIVSDGPTISAYTNGVFASTRNQSLPGNNSFLFNIGGGGVFDGAGNFFAGQIDEVALFSRALTAAEICNQYAAAVPTAPNILTPPAAVTVFEGATLKATVEVCGSPSLSYHWFRGATEIAITTVPVLTVSPAKLSDSGSYHVTVSNDFGSIDSDPFDVTVTAASVPSIVQAPESTTRYAGANWTAVVKAEGTPPLTYQWLFKGQAIKNATNATYTLSPVKTTDAGDYRVVVTNPVGSTPSSDATLDVVTPALGSYAALLTTTQPSSYWPLAEESGSTAHDLVGGLDGTYNNFVFGNDYPFDGSSSYVSTPASLNGKGAFTMSGWIRRGGAQANRTGLFGQNDLVEFGFIDDSTVEAWVSAAGNSIDVPSPIADGDWAFVAVTGDNSITRLFINGSEVGNLGVQLQSYGSSSYFFNIGGGGVFDATGNFFLGGIRDVALHSRALSANEICALYLNGTGNSSLVAVELGGADIADTKPSGTPHPGQNHAAKWLDSDSGRKGVMQFNGGDGSQIVIPANADFNTKSGTYSLWIRTAGATGPGNEGAILFDRRSNAGDVLVLKDDGTLFVQANGGSGTVNSFSSTVNVADDAWHHVVYVYDQSNGGSTTLYVDGIAAGTGTASAAWSWIATQPIEIGKSHDSYWKLFNGEMDDFRVYSRPLNDSEITQLAQGDASAAVARDALKVRFSFDQIPGGVTLRWTCGTLQVTDELKSTGGVWTDVLDAVSPYPVSATPGNHFYRVRY